MATRAKKAKLTVPVPVCHQDESKSDADSAKVSTVGSDNNSGSEQGQDQGQPFPMLPPEVWENILKSVTSLDTLKTCRLVCKLWNNLVTPVMAQRSRVQIEICHGRSGGYCGLRRKPVKLAVEMVQAAQARDDLSHPFKYIHLDIGFDYSVRGEELQQWIPELVKMNMVVCSVSLDCIINEANETVEDLEPYFTAFGAMETIESFDVETVSVYEKVHITQCLNFMKRMPRLRRFDCVLFITYGPFFEGKEWDADVVRDFAQLTHLKKINVGLRPMSKMMSSKSGMKKINGRINCVGKAIRKALKGHRVEVNFSNDTYYVGLSGPGWLWRQEEEDDW